MLEYYQNIKPAMFRQLRTYGRQIIESKRCAKCGWNKIFKVWIVIEIGFHDWDILKYTTSKTSPLKKLHYYLTWVTKEFKVPIQQKGLPNTFFIITAKSLKLNKWNWI